MSKYADPNLAKPFGEGYDLNLNTRLTLELEQYLIYLFQIVYVGR